MKALLLIAHGSRLPASNEEVRELARMLGDRLAAEFDIVDCAFLELAAPTIDQAIDGCVTRGCTRLTLLPYFLAAGRHLRDDIPAIVAAKQQQYPGIRITTSPYLGQADGLLDILVALSRQAPSS